MAQDTLSMTLELKDNLSKQIQEDAKNMERLAEVVQKLNVDLSKIDGEKLKKNLTQNLNDAEKGLYKLLEAKEKIDKALSRNTSLKDNGFIGVDDTQLNALSKRLDDIIEKIMSIGAEANFSKNYTKDLIASLSTDIALKETKSVTSAVDKELNNQVKERIKSQKESAKEAAAAEKEEEDAAKANIKNQELIKDALAKIATARANLSAASKDASEQEKMHAQLLMNLLDRLSGKLSSLKGEFLGEKGALDGVLGGGYQGLMRNVKTTISNINKSFSLDQGDVNMMSPEALDAAAQKMEDLARKIVKTKTEIEDTKKQLQELEEGEKEGRFFPKEKELLGERLATQQSQLAAYESEMRNVSNTVMELSAQLRFMNAEGQHITTTFGSAGAAAQAHAARQRELSEAFGAYFDEIERKEKERVETEKRETAEREEYNKKLAQTQKLLDAIEKVKLDERSKREIANIKGKTAEYNALGNKLAKILELESRVAENRELIRRGVSINPYTKEEVTKELERIQREYNEDLARGQVEEERATKARKKLAGASEEAARSTQKQASANRGLMNTFRELENAGVKTNRMLEQMGQSLATYFSFYGIKRFVEQVITIGGQFEFQHKALQNILGDAQEANMLFMQLQELAVESPKTFMELTGYSKQLSAYQIPAEELFDTTKRLADLSTGLGVDMSRLILAYGQVRSAAVLRGQELRQFTEAGIPMVQALANKFTEMNGKLTTTADVFKLISSRAVPFKMVKEVLWDMTDQGGQFYNMQEELADTLYGKWQKLADTWQIMLGRMADGNTLAGTFLRTMLDFTVAVTRNLDNLVPLFGSIAIGRMVSGMRPRIENLRKSVWESSDNNAISTMRLAKEKEANRLMRERVQLGRTLTAEEWALIRNKSIMTSQDYLLLAYSGKISEQKVAQLAIDGKINTLEAYRLALAKGYTKEQIRQMRNGNLSMLQGGRVGLKDALSAGGIMGLAKQGFGSLKTFLGGWPGLILTAIGLFSSFVDILRDGDEELEMRAESMVSHAQKASNSLATTLNQIEKSGDTTYRKIEVLEEALISMGAEGKRIVEDSRKIEDIEGRFKSLTEQAEAYKKVLEDMGTPEGKSRFQQMLEDSDVDDEVEEYNEYRDTEFRLTKPLTKFTAKYTQMIEALKAKHKELNDELNSSSLFENLRTLLSGKYANEAIGYYAGNARDALTNYYNAIKESEDKLKEIDENVVPKMAESVRAQIIASGVDLTKSFEKLSVQEKEIIRAAITEASKGVKNASDDTINHIADRLAKGFYTQLYVDVITKNQYTGFAEQLDLWQQNNGIKLWGESDLNSANSNPLGFSEMMSKRRNELQENEKKLIKNISKAQSENKPLVEEQYNRQLKDTQAQLAANIKSENEGFWSYIDHSKRTSGRGSQTDEVLKGWRERKKALDEYYKLYEEYSKYMSKEEAIKRINDTGLLRGQALPENIDDYLAVMKTFMDSIKGDIKGTERQSFWDSLVSDYNKKDFEKNTKETVDALLKQLDEELKKQGKQWDLYKKILDATGNAGQASDIAFGGNTRFKNFAEQLRDEIGNALANNSKANGKSIDELLGMDDKSLQNLDIFKNGTDGVYVRLERLREVEQALKAENVDLFLEAIKNAKSLDTELDQIELKYQKTIKAIRENGGDPTLEENARREADREKASKQWEWFKKNTDGWGEIFSNLDYASSTAIDAMIENLERALPTIKADEQAVKALYEALDKLRAEKTERNPFSSLFGSIAQASRIRGLLSTGFMSGNFSAEMAKKYGVKEGHVTREQLQKALRSSEANLPKAITAIGTKFQALQKVMQPVIELFETLGETGVSDILNIGNGMFSSAAGVAEGFQSLQGLFKEDSPIGQALGAAGPYAAAAASAFSMVSGIFALHDKALQEEIDASKARQKELENLTKNLERVLDRTLGGIYNTKASQEDLNKLLLYVARNNYGKNLPQFLGGNMYGYLGDDTLKAIGRALETETYYDTKLAELMLQRDEVKKQMQAEEDKKDSDGNAIEDYKNQIAELDDEIKYFAQDMAKALYDIDVKSWASELGDALFEAWKKGEDAAEAWKKKVGEIIADVSKNIIVTKMIETAFKPVEDYIVDMMTENSGMLDPLSFANGLIPLLDTAYNDVSGTLSTTLDAIEAVLQKNGMTMKDSSSSTASKVIQGGFTENETGLLLSYVNAIRADVSINRYTLEQIMMAVQGQAEMPSIASAQLAELRTIASNTRRNADFAADIYDILKKAQTGVQGLKVV